MGRLAMRAVANGKILACLLQARKLKNKKNDKFYPNSNDERTIYFVFVALINNQ